MRLYLVDQVSIDTNLDMVNRWIDTGTLDADYWRGYRNALWDIQNRSLSPAGYIDSDVLEPLRSREVDSNATA